MRLSGHGRLEIKDVFMLGLILVGGSLIGESLGILQIGTTYNMFFFVLFTFAAMKAVANANK